MSLSASSIRNKSLHKYEGVIDYWIRENAHSNPELSDLFRRTLASQPIANWIGNWTPNPRGHVRMLSQHAKRNNEIFQIVLYNIPNRDLGGFSAGGCQTREVYLSWIREVARGVGSADGILIIEPDALAHAAELDEVRREERFELLRRAAKIIRQNCRRARIYIDVGHPQWLSSGVVVEYVSKSGIEFANGISLNISNSHTTEDCYNYGMQIVSSFSENYGIIIDTSRNGAGPPPSHITGVDFWANVRSNRLGQKPSLEIGSSGIFSDQLHGVLWIKVPGTSDGAYNGAPNAGEFWPEGAYRLINGVNPS